MKKLATTLALFGALGIAQSASAITVDGDISDWFVTVADGGVPGGAGASSYDTASMDASGINYAIEDTYDLSNAYNVGPYGGGQNFDAEFLGMKVDGTTLYITIMSGQRVDNGTKTYIPGDVKIKTSSGMYGMEFSGANYVLNPTSALGTGVNFASWGAGDVVKGATWSTSPLDGVDTQMNADGTYKGTASYAFAQPSNSTDMGTGWTHSILEVAIDMSLFEGGSVKSITWAPACDNDTLTVSVPAPQALGLLGLGLIGLGAINRRRKA